MSTAERAALTACVAMLRAWEHRCGDGDGCPHFPHFDADHDAALAAAEAVLREPAQPAEPPYDKTFGDERDCACGHPYYRHFDTYADMAPVGCKYCDCCRWVPGPTAETEARSDYFDGAMVDPVAPTADAVPWTVTHSRALWDRLREAEAARDAQAAEVAALRAENAQLREERDWAVATCKAAREAQDAVAAVLRGESPAGDWPVAAVVKQLMEPDNAALARAEQAAGEARRWAADLARNPRFSLYATSKEALALLADEIERGPQKEGE
jgi:hypothetical protein